MPRYDVAEASELTPGQMKGFSVGGQRLLIVNLKGQFHAFDDLCPHLSVPLSRGRLNDDCLTCVGHGSEFDVQTGAARKWLGRKPGLISSLADGRPSGLTQYKISVEAGRLFVEL
jgi:nitrite reductase/ring-hydroxylating ferredoxin subunit